MTQKPELDKKKLPKGCRNSVYDSSETKIGGAVNTRFVFEKAEYERKSNWPFLLEGISGIKGVSGLLLLILISENLFAREKDL